MTELNSESTNPFEAYVEWIRGFSAQLQRIGAKTDFIIDDFIEIGVDRVTPVINFNLGGRVKDNQEQVTYLVCQVRVRVFREDFGFWDKFLEFSFDTDSDSDSITAQNTFLILNQIVKEAKNALLNDKDIESIATLIKLKVPPLSQANLDVSHALVGGSLAMRITCPSLFTPKAIWQVTARVNRDFLDNHFIDCSAFETYDTAQLPQHVGSIDKQFVNSYENLIRKAFQSFEDLKNDGFNL